MKHVLLSADNIPSVYSVPDEVADNLRKYCIDFESWLRNSPNAKKYRTHGSAVCFNEEDFINYLNTWIFPNTPSILIETLGSMEDITGKFKDYEWLNF
jgi:hypothetical protein